MAWSRKGTLLDMGAIIQQAEIIWPPRTKNRDGFEVVEESTEVKALKKHKKQLPTDETNWRAAFGWFDAMNDDLKRFGQVSLAAHHHPEQWKKILNRIKALRDRFPGRSPGR